MKSTGERERKKCRYKMTGCQSFGTLLHFTFRGKNMLWNNESRRHDTRPNDTQQNDRAYFAAECVTKKNVLGLRHLGPNS